MGDLINKPTLPREPWNPAPVNYGVLASKTFEGSVTKQDLQLMAMAILQMCDEMALMRKIVADHQSRLDGL